ncbi:MAG: SMUG2 DNA glycosylase family protein [Tannerellaceae bacterium]|nr:SMUG2 DNA glycosylase family protein [Tannerellaceae bacterium]
MRTFAEHVIDFNRNLSFTGVLPEHIRLLNPFENNPEVNRVSEQFYRKYYGDTSSRKMIIGINPGRLGAGATGIPFTDSKRLEQVCKIPIDSVITHEPSSVFIYDVIDAYGGAEQFYGDFYINSVCPLGFVIRNKKGNWVNCNYYDDRKLYEIMYDFMVQSLAAQLDFGIDRQVGYVLGKKNLEFLRKINDKERFFNKLVVLEHPRFIVQYKPRETRLYVDKYICTLHNIQHGDTETQRFLII